jgi:hypothetical protein
VASMIMIILSVRRWVFSFARPLLTELPHGRAPKSFQKLRKRKVFLRGKSPRYPLDRRLGWSQSRSGRCEQNKLSTCHCFILKMAVASASQTLVPIFQTTKTHSQNTIIPTATVLTSSSTICLGALPNWLLWACTCPQCVPRILLL